MKMGKINACNIFEAKRSQTQSAERIVVVLRRTQPHESQPVWVPLVVLPILSGIVSGEAGNFFP